MASKSGCEYCSDTEGMIYLEALFTNEKADQ